jgi:putative ABC transport system permease protein
VNFIESIRIALKALWVNKMRSILTMLGIIIGISSVIVVVALGDGTKGAVSNEFNNIGANRIFIMTNYQEDVYDKDRLTYEDYQLISDVFSDKIAAKSIDYNFNGSTYDMSDNKEPISIAIEAVSDEYNNIESFEMLQGRFINANDINTRRSIIVIEESLAIDRFQRTDVLGEKMIVDVNGVGNAFIIVGIFEPPKSLIPAMGAVQRKAYIPYTTGAKILNASQFIPGMDFNLVPEVNGQEIIDEMIKVLSRKHNNIGENKYIGFSAEGQLEIINNVMQMLTLVVGAIASISLFVGGIGIMNIMLVSVTERTREIGIRKAIGATRQDILIQFLIEAVIISGIGGIIGTSLGILLSKVASNVIDIPAQTSIIVIIAATLFSTLVGIIAGLYPANKAAKLDPIDALRYE